MNHLPQKQNLIGKILADLASLREIVLAFDEAQATIRKPDGCILYWSKGARELYGWSAEEAVGKISHDLLRTAFPEPLDAINGRLQREGRWQGELRQTCKHGTEVWVAASWVLCHEHGRDIVLELGNDVTERRRLAQQLHHAQKMEAIGTLSGGMAHDFNNLLGVIVGSLDLARRALAGRSDAQELIQEAVDAALRGADLTRQLLALARQQPLEPKQLALNEVVVTAARLLRRILPENIEISQDLSPDLWPVVADQALVEASLLNLATNSRDAMPQGGRLTLTTANRVIDAEHSALYPGVSPGRYACIEVTDTGCGMTPDVLERIFEPFYTTKEQGRGTGLGLSMVFSFAKQSGGYLTAYSEVGIGSTFRLYLPRAVQSDASLTMPGSGIVEMGRGETVLLVEDNEALRRIVSWQITELGYRVVAVRDAAEALGTLEREPVDLLFTDVVLPGPTDGRALAAVAAERWPRVKVIMATGFSETGMFSRDGRLTIGGRPVRLLNKPFQREDLARALQAALDSVSAG